MAKTGDAGWIEVRHGLVFVCVASELPSVRAAVPRSSTVDRQLDYGLALLAAPLNRLWFGAPVGRLSDGSSGVVLYQY